ncbi:MAG: hypothetical protein U0694_19700 [Anaerolineae bacterium]
MGVRVYWDNDEKKIIWYVLEGRWTWPEFYAAYNEALELESSVSHRFHCIMDLRQAIGMPANILMHVKNLTDRQPDNIGITVMVTYEPFIYSLYRIGVKFYSKIEQYYTIVPTLEQAYVKIAEVEASYAPPSPTLSLRN